MDDLEKEAYIASLRNAVSHDGDASVDAVMKDVMSTGEFDAQDAIDVVKEMTDEVSSMDEEKQASELRDYDPEFFDSQDDENESPLPELPNAQNGNVRLRAAPNPNSRWHIGHARMPSVLGTYAEMYDGDFVVRFDDTDPANKRPDLMAYGQILEDIEYLGFEPDEVYYASNRMDIYYNYAEKLIKRGIAYVCSCESEKMRKDRRNGVRCDCYSMENQKELFENMVAGQYEPQDYVIRIATDMEHKNPAVRDWVAFRVLSESHPRDLEDEYDLWPTLDFQSAIDDYEIGITHIIRGIDLQDSEKRQKFIYEALGWEYPETLHWGRVSVDEYDVPLSSSTIKEYIESGKLPSWDSILSPTLESLKRRGITGQAIKETMLDLGLSTNDATLSMSQMYNKNRQIIDDRTDRAFVVFDDEYTSFNVYDGPQFAYPPLRPSTDEKRELRVGDRILLPDEAMTPVGSRVWLKGLGCYLRGRDALWFDTDDTEIVEEGYAPVGYWVPENNAVRISIEMPDGSIRKGFADATVSDAEEGKTVRFGLFGFVRISEIGDSEVKAVFCHE